MTLKDLILLQPNTKLTVISCLTNKHKKDRESWVGSFSKSLLVIHQNSQVKWAPIIKVSQLISILGTTWNFWYFSGYFATFRATLKYLVYYRVIVTGVAGMVAATQMFAIFTNACPINIHKFYYYLPHQYFKIFKDPKSTIQQTLLLSTFNGL